jgi:hypothetical protein
MGEATDEPNVAQPLSRLPARCERELHDVAQLPQGVAEWVADT